MNRIVDTGICYMLSSGKHLENITLSSLIRVIRLRGAKYGIYAELGLENTLFAGLIFAWRVTL